MAVTGGLKSFAGGIHPPSDWKELAKDKEITTAPLPETAYVLTAQNIGAPAKPIVEKGDKVKKGQKIAEATGFISAHVHAPISGEVKAMTLKAHPVTGANTPTMVIASMIAVMR